MRAHELVQLASIVAVHGSTIMKSRHRFPEVALDTFWTVSKCRQERWAATLKALSANATAWEQRPTTVAGLDVVPVLDEILMSEVLSRVWAAVCGAHDKQHGSEEAGPIAGSVLAGHLEARNRVLSWMVNGYGLGVEEAVGLNRRRLRNERWTDILLSFLSPRCEVQPYVFDLRRVTDWARAGCADRHRAREIPRAGLLLATLTAAYRDCRLGSTTNEDLNRRIAASVVACLPAALFDSLGCPASSLPLSLFQSCPDTQGHLNLLPSRFDWRRRV